MSLAAILRASVETELRPIRADLIGSTTCRAAGISATSAAPVLIICRRLIEAGHHPGTHLHAYRGDTVALVVHSIGEAAQLEINGDGTGFRRRRKPDAASPMRKSGQTWPAATNGGTR
jgi:hypothetical protein